MHAIVIIISMFCSLWLVPWLSANVQIKATSCTTATNYDYPILRLKKAMPELDRFNNAEAYREDLMNALESYDKMQSKEAILTLYDYMLNIIAMIYICYLSIIINRMAYYKADTDEALNSLNDVLSYPVDQSKQSLVTKQSNVYNIRNVSFS